MLGKEKLLIATLQTILILFYYNFSSSILITCTVNLVLTPPKRNIFFGLLTIDKDIQRRNKSYNIWIRKAIELGYLCLFSSNIILKDHPSIPFDKNKYPHIDDLILQ